MKVHPTQSLKSGYENRVKNDKKDIWNSRSFGSLKWENNIILNFFMILFYHVFYIYTFTLAKMNMYLFLERKITLHQILLQIYTLFGIFILKVDFFSSFWCTNFKTCSLFFYFKFPVSCNKNLQFFELFWQFDSGFPSFSTFSTNSFLCQSDMHFISDESLLFPLLS